MADLPVRRVLRALERAGFVLVRQRGSHRVYRNAQGRQLTFAYHDAVRLGTPALRRVARDAGLELERLLDLAWRRIDRAFAEGTPIDAALIESMREARKRHKEAGNPVVERRDGKLCWVPPEDIELDEEK